ncbi:hypothetical protein PAXRUDRAFT_834282 [Paxillus rubicundulus Ve08.2h10]|uniref:Uncharacterized protein n=1 Tax=Paxillus rubicundulus Ve08.2h10 TaxID=930991 RepID=A0A0D0C7Z1_9AGAM|nr:hypothetical protein PAXRUDRAFT_834282 [Paxillus rubicundulus Ve08.2h10]
MRDVLAKDSWHRATRRAQALENKSIHPEPPRQTYDKAPSYLKAEDRETYVQRHW